MSQRSRRLRNKKNTGLKAKVARLQAELKRLQGFCPLHELVHMSSKSGEKGIVVGDVINQLRVWKPVEIPASEPTIRDHYQVAGLKLAAKEPPLYGNAPAVAEIDRIQAFLNEANDNELFRKHYRLMRVTVTAETTPAQKGESNG